jgi:hypothetical protein
MKKIHLVLLSFGITLLACVLVMGGILLRQNYCRVTFICEEGCKHTAWQKKGESLDLSLVYSCHPDLYEEGKEPLGVFVDEERLLYYFEEILCENSKTYYLGKWHEVGPHQSQAFCFHTPMGDIMIYMDATAYPRAKEDRDAYYIPTYVEKFFKAYEALGGCRDDILYFTYRYYAGNTWESYFDETSVEKCLTTIFTQHSMQFMSGYPAGALVPKYYYPVEEILVTTTPEDNYPFDNNQ